VIADRIEELPLKPPAFHADSHSMASLVNKLSGSIGQEPPARLKSADLIQHLQIDRVLESLLSASNQ
jgi:hypothetical protein